MQLTQEQADILYPTKSNKIFVINHSYNEAADIGRFMTTFKNLTPNILVMVDDRTTDNTAAIATAGGAAYVGSFTWRHSFSHAKNLSMQAAVTQLGMQPGDWVMCLGADFALFPAAVPHIKSYISNPLNFFSKFSVREYTKDKVSLYWRRLMWRHHSSIFWEKSVHERCLYSTYRLFKHTFGLNINFSFSSVGGNRHLRHYPDLVGSATLAYKKIYYKLLLELDIIRCMNGFPETREGTLSALGVVLGSPQTNIVSAVNQIVTRIQAGETVVTMPADAENWLKKVYLER